MTDPNENIPGRHRFGDLQPERLQNYDWWSICKAVAIVLTICALLVLAAFRGRG